MAIEEKEYTIEIQGRVFLTANGERVLPLPIVDDPLTYNYVGEEGLVKLEEIWLKFRGMLTELGQKRLEEKKAAKNQ